MSATPPKGTFDVTPLNEETWKDSSLWESIQDAIASICSLFSLQELKTPIFEKTDLFKRSVGDGSDIVTKEMYEFQDKGGRDLALRPEGTASAVRAFIQARLYEKCPINKLYYFGPMFRYERQQKGRYRQHYQFGVELLGSSSPLIDAEAITILWSLYEKLGLQGLTVQLNSVGDLESRNQYRKELISYLTPLKDKLSADSQVRFEKNPLRILDSKDPQDQALLEKAPLLLDFLSEESKAHFEKTQHYLKEANIPFVINPKLVRGLDYYSHTVFEITCDDLGAQNTIGAGGRYDSLVQMLGGPDTPAIGFATGIERIAHTLVAQKIQPKRIHKPDLFLAPMDQKSLDFAYQLATELRASKIAVVIDPRLKKMAQAIQYAVKIDATFFAAIGDQEISSQTLRIKTLVTKEETETPINQIKQVIHENRTQNS